AAAEFNASEIQVVAQDAEQRAVGVGVEAVVGAVDVEGGDSGHASIVARSGAAGKLLLTAHFFKTAAELVVLYDFDAGGDFEGFQAGTAEFPDTLLEGAGLFGLDQVAAGDHNVAGDGVGLAGDGDVAHVGYREEHLFDFGGVDLLAADV